MAMKVIGQEAEEREQGSALSLVFDEVNRIQSIGGAGLVRAEKEDLPSWVTDLFEIMVEEAGLIENKLEGAKA